MTIQQNPRNVNDPNRELYVSGGDQSDDDFSWLMLSPEGNRGFSSIRTARFEKIIEEDIDLTEAKLTEIQNGGFSNSNQYTSTVLTDNRVDKTKPTGLNGNQAGRHINFTGNTWRRSNTPYFERSRMRSHTTFHFLPQEIRGADNERIITIQATPVSDFTEDALPRMIFESGLQDIRWEGDRAGATRVVQVRDQSQLPTPILGEIPAERFRSYAIDNNSTLTDGFILPTDGAPVSFFSENPDNNDLTFDIGTGTAIKGTNAGGLFLDNIIMRGENGTETLFDITQVDSEENSSLIINNCRFTNFASLGQIKGFRDVVITNTTFAIFDDGLTLDTNEVSFIVSNGWDSRNTSGTTDIEFKGTMEVVNMSSCRFTTSDNAHAMNIDPITTMICQGVVNGSAYVIPTGGTFFEAGSKTQTDPDWRFDLNGQLADSAVKGSAFFNGNATPTVITTVNTPVKVTGTTTAGELERFTHNTDGTLTYIGGRDITLRVEGRATIKIEPSLEDKNIAFYIAVNDTIVASTIIDQNVSSVFQTPTSPEFIAVDNLILSNGDTIKLFIENRSDSTNITVTSSKLIV